MTETLPNQDQLLKAQWASIHVGQSVAVAYATANIPEATWLYQNHAREALQYVRELAAAFGYSLVKIEPQPVPAVLAPPDAILLAGMDDEATFDRDANTSHAGAS